VIDSGGAPAPDAPASGIELACLDMAGTTVADDGLVMAAFEAAFDGMGVAPGTESRAAMDRHVRDTMGTPKIAVFRELFGEAGRAQMANELFEAAYDAAVRDGDVAPLPGALECIGALSDAGVRVALTTGFSARTRDLLLDALGWRDLADLALCPEDAGRGRPHPDMILAAVLRLGVGSVQAVAVAGDTAADMQAGRRAGASVVAGVLTGFDGGDRLLAAGASVVVETIGSFPGLLGLGG